MIINPFPMLGWNGTFKGRPRFLALQKRVAISGGAYHENFEFSISGDGDRYLRRPIKGDLADYLTNAGASSFAFPERLRRVGDYVWWCARLVDSGTTLDLNNRAFLFRAPLDDPEQWELVPTGIEGDIGGSRRMVDIAGNDDYIVALASSGHVAVSEDGGDTFAAYGNIGFTGTNPARTIAASSSGFAAGGISGQLLTASDPRSTWTARTSQFGTDTIAHIVAGNVFVATGANRISSAALNNLASWTARTSPVTGTTALNQYLSYADGRWFGGIAGITSGDGAAWSVPSERPQDVTGINAIYEMVFDGSTWRAYMAPVALAKGGVTGWANVEGHKLPSLVDTALFVA